MMIRLRLFKSNYAAQLKSNIQSGITAPYESDEFSIDATQTLPMNLEIYENICNDLYADSAHEYEDAITIYEALKDLPEVMASDPIFWESVSHSVFHAFLQKRWGKGDFKASVYNHWFVTRGLMRHGIANLWWAVRLTVDLSNTADPYRLTKVIFWNYSARTTFFGPSIFFRVVNARTGILSYLADHEELKNGIENIGRYIAMHYNRMGAVKQLAALPVEYFYEDMANNHEKMISYQPRNKRSVEEDDLSPEFEASVLDNSSEGSSTTVELSDVNETVIEPETYSDAKFKLRCNEMFDFVAANNRLPTSKDNGPLFRWWDFYNRAGECLNSYKERLWHDLLELMEQSGIKL